MDYGLFALAEWVKSQMQYVDYGTYGERDQGKAEAYEEVLVQIKTMQKEVQQWTLG